MWIVVFARRTGGHISRGGAHITGTSFFSTHRCQINGWGVKICGGWGWEISEIFNKGGRGRNFLKNLINKAGITRYDRTRMLWSTTFGGKFRTKNARAQA